MTWQPGATSVIDDATARHLAFPFALTTQAGTQVATYRVGSKHGVEPAGYVVASRSADNGATWQRPVVLSNCEGDERSAKLAQAPDGTIYAAVWAWRTSEQSSIRSMLRTSTDDGASWSYPQPLTFPHTSWSAATGLVWHDGRLIAAAYGSDGGEQYVALSDGAVVASGGGNWQEPALVVNGDELLCFLRYEYGSLRRICLSRSLDGGATWSVPQTVVNGGGQPAPFIAPDGTWLLAYRDTASSAWLCHYAWSDDNGATWQDGGNFSGSTRRYVYADWITLGDDIGLVYALESGDDAEVYLTRFAQPEPPAPPRPTVGLSIVGPVAVGDTVPASITLDGVTRPGEATIQSITEGPPMTFGILASSHPLATTSYSDEVIADSPLVYLRLGEASGTTAVDSSGNSRDFTYINTPTLGVTGAISDGDTAITLAAASSEAVFAAYDATWMPQANITVECWVKRSSAPGSTEVIASRWRADVMTSNDVWFTHLEASTGKFAFVIRGSDNTYNPLFGTSNVCDGNWHHVVGTYDGTNMTVYVDGSQENTSALGKSMRSTTTSFNIGRFEDNVNDLDGSLDEFAFYSTALSSTRVAAHYNAA